MTLYATLTVEWPLPDGRPGGEFRSEDLPDVFGSYRLGGDGILWRATYEERAAPEGEPHPLGLAMLMHQVGEENSGHTGYIALGTNGGEERDYVAYLMDGRLVSIRAGDLRAWADEARDARHALETLRDILASGHQPDIRSVAGYLEAALARLPPSSDPEPA